MKKSAPSSNLPPRPLNCFLLFRNDKQKEIVAKCNGANHRDISKVIAKWWKESTPDVKEYYRVRAEEEKEEHKRLYPDYKYCPKKKVGPKRVYNRKTCGNTFTSKIEENNRLMEHMYQSEETLKDLKDKEKVSVTTISKKLSSSRRTIKPKPRKSSIYNSDPRLKEHYPSSASTLSAYRWNYQDSIYFQPMVEMPRNPPSPSSDSSNVSGYSLKTPSPSSPFRILPYAYPADFSYDNNNSKFPDQEQLYSNYYPSPDQKHPIHSTSAHGSYMQHFSSNNRNRNDNNTDSGYISSAYPHCQSTALVPPVYPHFLYASTNRITEYTYSPIGTGIPDYVVGLSKCTNSPYLN